MTQIALQITHQFDEMDELGPRVLANMMQLVGTELWGQVRAESPVDHGRLAGSFLLQERDPLTFAVESNVEYAMAVHDGSGPRVIEPVNARALFWPGAAHPVARVNHPGTAANRYGDRAISTTEERIDEFAQMAVDAAIEGMGGL